jgi:hypothetical protein
MSKSIVAEIKLNKANKDSVWLEFYHAQQKKACVVLLPLSQAKHLSQQLQIEIK